MEKYCTARQATVGNKIWRMQFACWIPKATDTYSEYVILTAFPRQQWLLERASLLLYTTLPVLFLNMILFTQMTGGRKSVQCVLRGCTIRVSNPGRGKVFNPLKITKQLLGPMEPPIKWVPLYLNGVKAAGAGVKIKYERGCNSLHCLHSLYGQGLLSYVCVWECAVQ